MKKLIKEYWNTCEHFEAKGEAKRIRVKTDTGKEFCTLLSTCCFCKLGSPVKQDGHGWFDKYQCTRKTKTERLASWLICSPAWHLIRIWLDWKRPDDPDRYMNINRTQAAQRGQVPRKDHNRNVKKKNS